MKTITLVCSFILFCSLGSCQSNYDYKFEQDLYNCFLSEQKDRGIYNQEETIDKIEKIYIKHGILKGTKGKDYVSSINYIRENFKKIHKNQTLKSELNKFKNLPPSIVCISVLYDNIPAETLNRSKIKDLFIPLGRIEKNGKNYPELVVEKILPLYNSNDFDNDYFRALYIFSVAGIFKHESKGQEYEKLEDFVSNRENEIALKEWKRKVISKNQIRFNIKENGDIFLTKLDRNKEPIIYEDVSRYLEELINVSARVNETYNIPEIGRQGAKITLVTIQGDQNSNDYKEVKSRVHKFFNEMWRFYADHYYGKSWDKLNAEQQEWLKKLLPLILVEE